MFLTDARTKSSKRNRLVNPWITSGIIASINKKDYLYKKWKKTTSHSNKVGNDTYYMDFKNFRKNLKKIIKIAKQSYYSSKFLAVKGDMKNTWKLINEIRGKVNKQIKASSIINGKLIQNRRLIANEFNSYFTSIAHNMNTTIDAENIPLHGIPSFNEYMDNKISGSIYLNDCSSTEIENIISKLESGISSDIHISISVVKRCSKLISPFITKFYNNFMDKGIFPSILKIGRVTPIYKKGDPQSFGNYRPISTLPVFGKFFEKVIYNRLYSYFISKIFYMINNLVLENIIQLDSVNKITESIEDKKHVLGIFIDLSKAFDTIDHYKLMKKT